MRPARPLTGASQDQCLVKKTPAGIPAPGFFFTRGGKAREARSSSRRIQKRRKPGPLTGTGLVSDFRNFADYLTATTFMNAATSMRPQPTLSSRIDFEVAQSDALRSA